MITYALCAGLLGKDAEKLVQSLIQDRVGKTNRHLQMGMHHYVLWVKEALYGIGAPPPARAHARPPGVCIPET